MKRSGVGILAACLAILLIASGCSKSGQTGGTGDGGSQSGSETYSFRLATHYNTSHAGYAALERIAADLEGRSNGAIKVTLYPSSQLGDYTLVYEDLMKGTIEMALIPIPSQYDVRLGMNQIPYLVKDYSELEKVFGPDSYFFQVYSEVHEALDVKLLGIFVEGLVGFGFNKLPENYADPKAVKEGKIRTPPIEVVDIVTQDMGFATTSIPYADLYSALQTGVVDGWIGGTPQLNYSDFRDVIKYFVPYNVTTEGIGFFISKKVYDSLPQQYQTMIEEAFIKESLHSFTTAEELDMEAIRKMEEYGIEIVWLTDEQLEAYANHVKETTWPKLSDMIGEDVMQKLIKSL